VENGGMYPAALLPVSAYRFNTFMEQMQLQSFAARASVFIFICKQAINFILISNTFDSQC